MAMTRSTQTIAIDSRGISRGRYDSDRAIRANEDAERIALIDGDADEALRRRNAAADLRRKRTRPISEAEILPVWLVRDLGGPRDTIAYLIKDKALSVQQGRTALLLREYREGLTISIEGHGISDYVQGGQAVGMEAHCDKMRAGRHAWKLAQEACEAKAWKAVDRVICGKAGLKQARRLIGGGNEAAHATLKANLIRALNASTAYLGAGQ